MTVAECRQLLHRLTSMKKKSIVEWHISDYGEGYNQALSDVRSILVSLVVKEQLTSLSEVVRCKDCKHYGTGSCAMDTYAFDVVEEGFCSYGERKEATP